MLSFLLVYYHKIKIGEYSIMSTVQYAGHQILGFPGNRSAVPFWKLVYCSEGSGKIRLNRSEVVKYKQGSLVMIPPNRRHVNQSSEDFKGMVIDLAEMPLDIQKPTLVVDESTGEIRRICESICHYYSSTEDLKEQLLPLYTELLFETIRCFQKREAISPVVREVENTMIANFHDCGFELDEYLRTFSFSYDYLRKLFKKEMGVTPHRYLNDLRMNTAAAMFEKSYLGDANVSEVSRRCGFQEPLYFSRMFKKKFGLSPSHYEAKTKEKED